MVGAEQNHLTESFGVPRFMVAFNWVQELKVYLFCLVCENRLLTCSCSVCSISLGPGPLATFGS